MMALNTGTRQWLKAEFYSGYFYNFLLEYYKFVSEECFKSIVVQCINLIAVMFSEPCYTFPKIQLYLLPQSFYPGMKLNICMSCTSVVLAQQKKGR